MSGQVIRHASDSSVARGRHRWNHRSNPTEIVNGFEICRVADEIPLHALIRCGVASIGLADTCKVGCDIVYTPGRTSLDNRRCIDGPALEHLAEALLSGNGVGSGNGEAMAHVEGCACVELAAEASVAVSGYDETAARALVGGFAEGVSVSVTACERKPVIVPCRQNRLQSVIAGGV